MQSIESLLSPAGPNPSLDLFRQFGHQAQDPSDLLGIGAGDSGQADSKESTDRSDKESSPGSEVCFGLELRGKPVGHVMVWSDYKVKDMAEYDVEPLPLKEVLDDQDQGPKKAARADRGTRSQGVIVEQKVHWQKKDVVAKGMYKPWFFTRFARGWVPLGKPQCLSDLKHIVHASKNFKEPKAGADKEPKKKQQKAHESDSSDDEDEELWVQCEECEKWRRVPEGVDIDTEKDFFCTFLPGVTCKTPEEEWDEEEAEPAKSQKKTRNDAPSHHTAAEARDHSESRSERSVSPGATSATGSSSGKKRKSSVSVLSSDPNVSTTRNGKLRRTSPVGPPAEVTPMSPEDITTGSSLYESGQSASSPPAPSRLAAVVQVLTTTGKALHYDTLTRQALKLGLIRFTGSQGTAGESMKAFLNKTIRENKSTAIVNLGKGIYGLRDWDSATSDSKTPSGPSPTASQAQGGLSQASEDGAKPPLVTTADAGSQIKSESPQGAAQSGLQAKNGEGKENVGIAALLN